MNIPVIDDCIEAFGSERYNMKAGNLGSKMSIFSFQAVRLQILSMEEGLLYLTPN